MSKAIIQSNQAVEGTIAFLNDDSHLNLGPSINAYSNTVYKRGLIVALLGSTFYIYDMSVEQNTAY